MPSAHNTVLPELHEATQRLVRTVDALPDDQYVEPTGLPDWSRAHVVAHLALNAEGLAGALAGVVSGEPTPMYASQERRNSDIEELAASGPATLRERLLRATTLLADALGAVPEEASSTRIERTPGSAETFSAYAVLGMRLREVEIHHADLGLDYTRSDWPVSFSTRLLDAMVKRDWHQPFTAAAVDLGRTWQCGDVAEAPHPGPVVSGSAADLGWWLTGRGDGDGLTSDSGALPRIEEW